MNAGGYLVPGDAELPATIYDALAAADALEPAPTHDPEAMRAWTERRLAALVPLAVETLLGIAHDPEANEEDRESARLSLARRGLPPTLRSTGGGGDDAA